MTNDELNLFISEIVKDIIGDNTILPIKEIKDRIKRVMNATDVIINSWGNDNLKISYQNDDLVSNEFYIDLVQKYFSEKMVIKLLTERFLFVFTSINTNNGKKYYNLDSISKNGLIFGNKIANYTFVALFSTDIEVTFSLGRIAIMYSDNRDFPLKYIDYIDCKDDTEEELYIKLTKIFDESLWLPLQRELKISEILND